MQYSSPTFKNAAAERVQCCSPTFSMRSNPLAILHKDYLFHHGQWNMGEMLFNRREKCKQKQPIHLRWQCLTQFDKVACAKHFAAESILHRDRSEAARRSVAQMRQRQCLAKYWKDKKGPSDQACHFAKGSKRYDVQLPIFQLLFEKSVCDHFNTEGNHHE